MTRRGVETAFPPAFLRRWEKLPSLTPLELGIDPCPIRLAGAVAGSAYFPPLVGPITFRVGETEVYWHTGDGGLYENQGLESLAFVFLKQLQEKTARRSSPQRPWWSASPRSPRAFGWRRRVTASCWRRPPPRSWRSTNRRSSPSWRARPRAGRRSEAGDRSWSVRDSSPRMWTCHRAKSPNRVVWSVTRLRCALAKRWAVRRKSVILVSTPLPHERPPGV